MTTDRLIQEYKARGDNLGEELKPEEIDALIIALRQHLKVTDEELDLSPMSLKRLDQYLQGYHYRHLAENKTISNDETVQFVRDIAAYFGKVLMIKAGATWRGGNSLWDTSVQVEGLIKVVDGRNSYRSTKLVYALGAEAAAAWDCVTKGAKSQLYSSYLAMRKRVASQQL